MPSLISTDAGADYTVKNMGEETVLDHARTKGGLERTVQFLEEWTQQHPIPTLESG